MSVVTGVHVVHGVGVRGHMCGMLVSLLDRLVDGVMVVIVHVPGRVGSVVEVSVVDMVTLDRGIVVIVPLHGWDPFRWGTRKRTGPTRSIRARPVTGALPVDGIALLLRRVSRFLERRRDRGDIGAACIEGDIDVLRLRAGGDRLDASHLADRFLDGRDTVRAADVRCVEGDGLHVVGLLSMNGSFQWIYPTGVYSGCQAPDPSCLPEPIAPPPRTVR